MFVRHDKSAFSQMWEFENWSKMFAAIAEIVGCKFVAPVLPIARIKKIKGKFRNFHAISKFLLIYSTKSGGTPIDVLRNSGWVKLGSRW